MNHTIKPKNNLKGIVKVAPDKSISHRAVMFGSIAQGITEIENYLTGDDCLATIRCFKNLGINIEVNNDKITVHGKGLYGLTPPNCILDVGNSGTTIRLISGILAGQTFETVITGDGSIQKRPMKRIIDPLSEMGANIKGINNTNFAPLTITGTKLNSMKYTLKIASAQIKSAIILASLYANGETEIIEPIKSRNHSEIMLKYLGANIRTIDNSIFIKKSNLVGKKIIVPNDISSAAFFIVAALITKNSELTLVDVGINETRTGIIDVLLQMNANIIIQNKRTLNGEDIADIVICSSELKGTTIQGDVIPRMIDEIPVFAVAAAFAKGQTIIKDATELKVKESNRINAVVTEFKKFGIDIKETDDGMIINGSNCATGTTANCYDDHRIAMSLAVLGLRSDGETTINNTDCVNISFPDFFSILDTI